MREKRKESRASEVGGEGRNELKRRDGRERERSRKARGTRERERCRREREGETGEERQNGKRRGREGFMSEEEEV